MPRPLIGLDIGYLHIRAVRLVPKGRAWQVDRTAEVSRFDDLGQRKPLSRALAEIDSRLPLSKGQLTVASSELASMVRYEHNDPMPPDRMERVLRLELSQHAGMESGDDLAGDAVAIPLDGNEIIHCCGLAQPPQVIALLKELQQERIKPAAVQLGPAAQANILDALPIDEDEPRWRLVVDIGARSTRVILARGQDFIACRQLTTGGDVFTEQLAKAKGLRFDEAEMEKIGRVDPALRREGPGSETGAESSGIGPAVTPGPAMVPEPPKAEEMELVDDGPLDLSLDPVPSDPTEEAVIKPGTGTFSAEAIGQPAALPPMPDTQTQAEVEVGEDPFALVDDADDSEQAEGLADTASPAGDASADGITLDTSLRFEGADPQEATPAWQRQEAGFFLEEAEPLAPGQSTIHIGVARLGPEMLRPAEDLYIQVSKTLSWFQAQLRLRGVQVSEVYLVGGGSELTGLPAYFQRRFQRPVHKLDPFGTMAGDIPNLPHRFAQACGLARSGAPGAVLFDLRPESVQRKTVLREVVLWPRLAAALVLVAVGALLYAIHLDRYYDHLRLQNYQEQKAQWDSYTSQINKLRKQEESLKGDLRAVSARIFAGRDLLDAIRALKINAPKRLWVTRLSTHKVGKDATAGQVTSGERTYGADRTIDRGSLYLSGFVKPVSGEIFSDWYPEVEKWLNGLLTYTTKQRDVALFSDRGEGVLPIESETEDKAARIPFTYEFYFRPTTIDEFVDTSDRSKKKRP